MKFEDIKAVSPELWPKIWELYEGSFPVHERRSRKAQLKAFDDPKAVGRVMLDDEELAAILFYWLQGEMVYIEFLAVNPAMRGRNIGTAVVEKILSMHPGSTVVLEIEPPEDDTTRRRLRFYERLGFVSNSYTYIHPSYRSGEKAFPHQLALLSYGRSITQEEYNGFVRFMEETVWKYSD